MLDTIVRYLHHARVPFRVASYPSPEREPKAGHPLPPGGMLIETRLLAVDGRLVLACVRTGDHIDVAAFGSELGGVAVEAPPGDVPAEIGQLGADIPPLGKLLGLPLIVEEGIEACATVVFCGRGGNDYLEVPYDDFARLEQPRVASFARAGELERGASAIP